jgi:hypothetical protein
MTLQTVCLWPGLPAAWHLGQARGLWVALFFCWSLCLLLVATFVWPEWIAASWLRLFWLAALATWLIASIRNCLRLRSLLEVTDTQGTSDLTEAQIEYLRGNWFEAEAILLEALHRRPRDPEATLLLAGVLRRTKRWRPALRRLEQLALLETAAGWQFEISREKALIERSLAEETHETRLESETANMAAPTSIETSPLAEGS